MVVLTDCASGHRPLSEGGATVPASLGALGVRDHRRRLTRR